MKGEWFRHSVRQQEYQIILELSEAFSVKTLCCIMGIPRSSFYVKGVYYELMLYMELWNNETILYEIDTGA